MCFGNVCHTGPRPAKSGGFLDPKPASISTGVVAGTNSGQRYQCDRPFFSSGFGETHEVSREFQCNDQQGWVSEVQAFSGGWEGDCSKRFFEVENAVLGVMLRPDCGAQSGGLLACGPKRGLREESEFCELDSKGTVSDSADWLASGPLF